MNITYYAVIAANINVNITINKTNANNNKKHLSAAEYILLDSIRCSLINNIIKK